MVTIEPISPAHLPMVQIHASHPSIGATSTVPHPYPTDGATQWFKLITARMAAGQSQVFAIKLNGEFCGLMTLNDINQEAHSAALDYWVAFEFQGRGICTEAAGLAIRHARESLGLTTLSSGCLARNVASARVLEKNGFKEIGSSTLEGGKFKGEAFRQFQPHIDR